MLYVGKLFVSKLRKKPSSLLGFRDQNLLPKVESLRVQSFVAS